MVIIGKRPAHAGKDHMTPTLQALIMSDARRRREMRQNGRTDTTVVSLDTATATTFKARMADTRAARTREVFGTGNRQRHFKRSTTGCRTFA